MNEHIVKHGSGYRLLSHKGKNLGDFPSHEAAAKHEREVEYFKHEATDDPNAMVNDTGSDRSGLALESTLTEDVADIIYQQLGARRFAVMTGAKNFSKKENSLTFKLPRAKDGSQYVTITLNGKDLYDIETFSVRAPNYNKIVKSTEHDVYAEDLRRVFTRITGLYTSL